MLARQSLALLFACVLPCLFPLYAVAQEAALEEVTEDPRLSPLIDLNGHFPFKVPESKAAWESRAAQLKKQVLIATGLWPLPERTPLNPVIHGKSSRDGFTVEKVYFESMPNHFVTGLLFRPDDGKEGIRRPAVLSPHGHGGRQQDYGIDKMAALIESGAEKYEQSGRFPKLARCAHLARMGCVVFIFDMLGYADSQQISEQLAHRFAKQRPEFESKNSWGLYSAQAEMRLQSIMGIQTWNAIRCLDFLEQLPDVDATRIGVTGGSGGGTQTILLCAIDDRPIVAFPNGMVSTSMQGGCTCENCSLLRIGTGNVELAALFAPKPQAMTAADDWTKDMMTDGYPELQRIYDFFNAKDNVYCREMLHFPHNYNFVSRATMYEWFNKYLGLEADVVEKDFSILTPEETTVWDSEHPQPAGGETYERELTDYLAKISDQQIKALTPKDETSLQEYRQIVGGAFETILASPNAMAKIERTKLQEQQRDGYTFFKDRLQWGDGQQVEIVSLYPSEVEWNGQVVIVVDGAARSRMFNEQGDIRIPPVRRMLDSGASVVRVGLLQPEAVAQRVVENPREVAAYTYCYNQPLFAHRVQDVLAVIDFARNAEHKTKKVNLLGIRGAGPVTVAAGMLAGSKIDKSAINTEGFRFEDITSYRDPNFVPGAVKYGDLPALLALTAPLPLMLVGEDGKVPPLTQSAYSAAGQPSKVISTSLEMSSPEVTDWLLQD